MCIPKCVVIHCTYILGVCAEYVYVCACVHTCMYIHTYVAICSNVSGEVFGGTRSRVEK